MDEQAVLAILGRYFDALQNGTAAHLLPDPGYPWPYYRRKGEVTIERLRAGLVALDAYLNAPGQHNWAQENIGKKAGLVFDRGPDLARLPDAALLALFQELDALFAAST